MGKDILITPGDALINFSGASAGNINQIVQDDGRVSFIGISSGAEQLTISDSLTGSVFTVNNSISSPIIDIDFDNTITVPHGASDGYVWTSDSGGTATWQTSPGLSNIFVNKTTYVDALNGNDSTGVRGDLSLPYITISGANQTSITGDTVHVRPGTYQEYDIITDGISYYFDKGAIVHPTAAQQIAAEKSVIHIEKFNYKPFILGYGEFISDFSGSGVGDLNINTIWADTLEAHLEFDLAYRTASSAVGGARATVQVSQRIEHAGPGFSGQSQEIFVKGIIKKDTTLGGAAQSAMIVGAGNVRFEGKIINNGYGTAAIGLNINNDSADFRGTGDIYVSGTTSPSIALNSNTRGKSMWYGNVEAEHENTCYAYKTDSNYSGISTISGKIVGAIWLSLGGFKGQGCYLSGIHECGGSPNGYAIKCDDDASINVIDLLVNTNQDVFNITDGTILFQGSISETSDNKSFLTQSGGKLIFNGVISPHDNRLTESTIIGPGETILQSDFESWGSASGTVNQCVFYVSGGTLNVNSCKVKNHNTQTGSGVIKLDSAPTTTLILNNAELIGKSLDPSVYSIETPGTGAYDVVIYGDSYTNRPVGPGTIRNTILNGGFLYDLTGCTTVREYCGLNITGDTKIDGNVTINTSGNTATPVFKILGSTGELFTITDSLLGELFAVNDISGLPILRVLSDDTVLMGNIQAPSLNTTSKKIVNAGSTILYDIPSSGYTSAYFDYNIVGNAGARAGNVMSIWSGTSINYAETATSDIGDTSPVTLSVAFSGSNTSFIASAITNNWVVKTIVRSI